MARAGLQAFLLCDSMPIDQHGKTTVQGILGAIQCKSLPTTLASLGIFVRLSLPPLDSCDVEFEVRTPAGAIERAAQPQKVQSGDDGIAELRVTIQAIPFREAGRYVWSLIVDGSKVADYHFTVFAAETVRRPSI